MLLSSLRKARFNTCHASRRRQVVGVTIRTIQTQTLADKFQILFMGRDEFSCLVLKELFEAKDVWEGITIATQPDMYIGRRRSVLSVSPLKVLGEQLRIPVHAIPEKKPEFRQWKLPPPFLCSPEDPTPPPNHLLLTASFGRILTASQLNSFMPTRRLNLHPSLLPEFRGPAPIQHTLLNGDKETGVCVIEMLKKQEGIDAGAIWGSKRLPVPCDADFLSLRRTLAVEGGQLLVSVLRKILDGTAVLQTQCFATSARFAPMIKAEDVLIDFSVMSAETIARRYRALSHHRPLLTYISSTHSLQLHDISTLTAATETLEPQSLTDIRGCLPSIPGSAVYSKPTNSVLVRCEGGSVLTVATVKQEGRRLMPVREWWNGLRDLEDGRVAMFGLPEVLRQV